jgi:hypothetical protein
MGIALGFADQMLGAAETDFEVDKINAIRKQTFESRRWRLPQVDGKLRQRCCEQVGLMLPQFLAPAAAEKGPAGALIVCGVGGMHNGRILDAAVAKIQPMTIGLI